MHKFYINFIQDNKLYWSKNNVSFDNKPFRPTKIQKLHCQFWPYYYKAKKRKTERVLVQTTRKRDCPAMIIIREYEVFPEYALKKEIKGLSGNALRKMHTEKLEELRKALQEGKGTIQTTSMYHVSLPTNGAHKGHQCGQESGMAQRMHPMVSQKITLLVREGA